MIKCSNCGLAYPDEGLPFRCPVCSGVFEFAPFPALNPDQIEFDLPGFWRYRHSFGLPDNAPVISLGEGDTPLSQAVADDQVYYKAEYQNPTGSHKDRGAAIMTSLLVAKGIDEAVEDSSGNAGSAFAAYAARAGIRARVFVPDYASGPKRTQIEAYGAEVVRIMGPRSKTSEAVLRASEKGAVYASHAYFPHLLGGFATVAYEVTSQLGQTPEVIVAPVGQGGLLYGIGLGFENLLQAGMIDRVPKLVGVQAAACAPLWAVHTAGSAGLGWVTERETLAEGVRIHNPLRGDLLLKMVEKSGGTFVAVEEEHILEGRNALASQGFYVEPTSAIVWDGLRQVRERAAGPVVVILSGSGLKSSG
jgi:threonine synthase